MKIKEIAKLCGLTVYGNGDFQVEGITYSEDAQEQDISVAFKKSDIFKTKSKVVLSEPFFEQSDKILLLCQYGQLFPSLVKIAKLLAQNDPQLKLCCNSDFAHNQEKFVIGPNSVIGKSTIIGPFSTIGRNVCIGDNCVIESNVFIGDNTVIGENCVIHSGAKIGVASYFHYKEDGKNKVFEGIGKTIINSDCQIGFNSVIQRGTLSNTVIGKNVLIGNLVLIAHDVKIGDSCMLICQSGISGRVIIGKRVSIWGKTGVKDNVSIGDDSCILAMSAVTKNVGKGKVISGLFSREHKKELKIQGFIERLFRK